MLSDEPEARSRVVRQRPVPGGMEVLDLPIERRDRPALVSRPNLRLRLLGHAEVVLEVAAPELALASRRWA